MNTSFSSFFSSVLAEQAFLERQQQRIIDSNNEMNNILIHIDKNKNPFNEDTVLTFEKSIKNTIDALVSIRLTLCVPDTFENLFWEELENEWHILEDLNQLLISMQYALDALQHLLAQTEESFRELEHFYIQQELEAYMQQELEATRQSIQQRFELTHSYQAKIEVIQSMQQSCDYDLTTPQTNPPTETRRRRPSYYSSKKEKPNTNFNKVQFSALAPTTLASESYSIIEILMYEEAWTHIVDNIAATTANTLKETRSGFHTVSAETPIKIVLTSPQIPIEDNEETLIWQGDYLRFMFSISLPKEYTKQQVLFNASVYTNDVILTRLKFTVKCIASDTQKIEILKQEILSAFVSYASQDRNRVIRIIQGMKKVRPDIDLFFDLENLHSGEFWRTTLMSEIEKRDLLFLFWSEHAQMSEWVNKEWRYALQCHGIEAIEPIPLTNPNACPPPKELDLKHFNDKLLYMINENI